MYVVFDIKLCQKIISLRLCNFAGAMSVMDGDYAYIGKEVSQPLIHAVSEVCDVRPSDPITYIADSLRKYSRENSKVSDAQSDGDSREQAQVSKCLPRVMT